jgi:hypothetical protein
MQVYFLDFSFKPTAAAALHKVVISTQVAKVLTTTGIFYFQLICHASYLGYFKNKSSVIIVLQFRSTEYTLLMFFLDINVFSLEFRVCRNEAFIFAYCANHS